MIYKILKYFTSIRKIWSIVVICEIKIHEIANESPFAKYILNFSEQSSREQEALAICGGL